MKEAILRSDAGNFGEIDKLFEFLLSEIGAGRITKEPVLNLLSEGVAREVGLRPFES